MARSQDTNPLDDNEFNVKYWIADSLEGPLDDDAFDEFWDCMIAIEERP